MKWMQFFTPAKSLDPTQARSYLADHPQEAYTLLDVRQEKEYKDEHLPGAQLIPLPQLGDRLNELDKEKPVLVYCAIGGRSRVAAQMLAGKGFSTVYNMSGGIKAWHGDKAVGLPDLGMDLFNGKEAPEDILKVAYSLEQGLREFYLEMEKKAQKPEVKNLFAKLAQIEVKHQETLLATYNDLTGESKSQAEFESLVQTRAMEGGLTTQEYLDLFNPDLNLEVDVISLAMSIEAQALDLYQRVGFSVQNPEAVSVINKIANEEKAHLASLGKLMDTL